MLDLHQMLKPKQRRKFLCIFGILDFCQFCLRSLTRRKTGKKKHYPLSAEQRPITLIGLMRQEINPPITCRLWTMQFYIYISCSWEDFFLCVCVCVFEWALLWSLKVRGFTSKKIFSCLRPLPAWHGPPEGKLKHLDRRDPSLKIEPDFSVETLLYGRSSNKSAKQRMALGHCS